jgi:nitroreductase
MKESKVKNDEYELLIKIIKERRSIRSFRPEVPEMELILKLIDAARYAPSATNFQPWKFFVITNPEVKDKMANLVSDKLDSLDKTKLNREVVDAENVKKFGREYFLFFRKAPAVIATFFKPYPVAASLGYESSSDGKEKMQMLSIESTSAAVQNILLAAHALGLGACWLDGPLIARMELEEMLNVDEPWRLMCLVAVGYPKVNPSAVRRKKLAVVSKFIT